MATTPTTAPTRPAARMPSIGPAATIASTKTGSTQGFTSIIGSRLMLVLVPGAPAGTRCAAGPHVRLDRTGSGLCATGSSDFMVTMASFRDRADAGRQLAAHLRHLADKPALLVLGLPKGGVPVAFEVARALDAPLDAFIVRKLGVPGHEELAMGAIASGDIRVMNEDVVRGVALPEEAIAAVAAEEQRELERQERELRDANPPPDVDDRIVVLVDDGLATGSTMRAAIRGLRQRGANSIVVGVPIASPEVCAALEAEADEVVCAHTPEQFGAVSAWYEDFPQVTDEQVRELLKQAQR